MSDRDAFRAEQQTRRQFGKAKQHEKRLENATYTAAEVKVLTETASKVAYALGRKDAGEEIAAKFEYLGVILGSYVAKEVRSMSSQPSQDASDAISVPSEGPGTYEPSKATKTPSKAACPKCGAYGGNGRIYRQDDTWDSCPVCTPGLTEEPS